MLNHFVNSSNIRFIALFSQRDSVPSEPNFYQWTSGHPGSGSKGSEEYLHLSEKFRRCRARPIPAPGRLNLPVSLLVGPQNSEPQNSKMDAIERSRLGWVRYKK